MSTREEASIERFYNAKSVKRSLITLESELNRLFGQADGHESDLYAEAAQLLVQAQHALTMAELEAKRKRDSQRVELIGQLKASVAQFRSRQTGSPS